MIAEGLVPAASLADQLAPAPIPAQLAVAQVRLLEAVSSLHASPTTAVGAQPHLPSLNLSPSHHNLRCYPSAPSSPTCAAPHLQEVGRPLCAITSSSHSVPGGQLSFQPGTAGNDRIGMVPLERWDVELAPADNPAGAGQRSDCFTLVDASQEAVSASSEQN